MRNRNRLRVKSPSCDGKPDLSGFWDNPKEPGSRGPATVSARKRWRRSLQEVRRSSTSRAPATRDTTSRAPSACLRVPSAFWTLPDSAHSNTAVSRDADRVHERYPHRSARRTSAQDRYRADLLRRAGRSLGRDTLVIEGRNYKRWSLDDYYYQNPKEYRMHTEALRTTERLRRTDADTIS